MLIRNIRTDLGLVNGAIGVVTGFTPYTPFPPSDTVASYSNGVGVGGGDDPSAAAAAIGIKRASADAADDYHQVVAAVDKDYAVIAPSGVFPIVHFPSCASSFFAFPTVCASIESGPHLLATRKQVPLQHAWSITVHKSQGLSLDKIEFDFCNVFSDGQVYVALSRVRKMDGLRLRNFDPSKITCNRRALEFYRRITPATPVVADSANSSAKENTTLIVKT
jgi:hypothetical protein